MFQSLKAVLGGGIINSLSCQSRGFIVGGKICNEGSFVFSPA